MVSRNDYYFYVASYPAEKLRNSCILFLDVFYFQIPFLIWINADSRYQISDDKKVFYFLGFRRVWKFLVQIIYKIQKIFFKKQFAPDVNVAYENRIFLFGRFLSFWNGSVGEKYLVCKKNFPV